MKAGVNGVAPVPFLDHLHTPIIITPLYVIFPGRIHKLWRAHNNDILSFVGISILRLPGLRRS